jgi:hypothetical protein
MLIFEIFSLLIAPFRIFKNFLIGCIDVASLSLPFAFEPHASVLSEIRYNFSA